MLHAPASSDSGLSHGARRMLEAIENLPDGEREVFSLVRIQGMPQTEVAELLGVSAKTIQRRLNRGLIRLTEELCDLQAEHLQPAKRGVGDRGAGETDV